MKHALRRRGSTSRDERIDDVKPAIPLGKRFWALAPERTRRHRRTLRTHEVVHASSPASTRRDDDAKIKVLDAAYWMKGCSSLGRLRYAVLLGVGRKATTSSTAWSTSRRPSPPPRPRTKRAHAAGRLRRARRRRRPRPLAVPRRTHAGRRPPPPSRRHARADAAGPQARDRSPDPRRGRRRRRISWPASSAKRTPARWTPPPANVARRTNRNRSRTLDAPGWLWTAVVELIASHEAGYLEHCRRYALA